MNPVTEKLKEVYRLSGDAVRFSSRTFGLRYAGAPPLPPHLKATFHRSLQLWVTALVVVIAAYVGLVWMLRRTIGDYVANAAGAVDLERIYSDWSWTTLAAFALGAFLLLVAFWSLGLRKRYGAHAFFIAVPLVLIVACVGFREVARRSVDAYLMDLYRKGLPLFDSKTWDNCFLYFSRLHHLFPASIIGDNALGRVAGVEFHKENYLRAIYTYSSLLKQYPTTDIESQTRRSIEWAVRRAMRQASIEDCARTYDACQLQQWGFSVFLFVLHPVQAGEAGDPQEFGSITMHDERRAPLEFLLSRYPHDPWAARAAFFIGSEEHIAAYPGTIYHRAAGVVRGWHLQSMQDYAGAASLYEEFLKGGGDRATTESVRTLLAHCYLAQSSVEEAFRRMQDGASTRGLIPPRAYHLFLERFAFMDDVAKMRALFDAFRDKLPGALSADMALILRERLFLDAGSETDETTLLANHAARVGVLTRTGRGEPYDSIGDFVSRHFDYGDDPVKVANSRLRQTSEDSNWQHFFDRNYAITGRTWPESSRRSYSDLLHESARRMVGSRLKGFDRPDLAAAELARLARQLRDPSLIGAEVQQFIAIAHGSGRVPSRQELSDILRASGPASAPLAELCARSIAAQPNTKEGMTEAIRLFELIPAGVSGDSLVNLANRNIDDAPDPIAQQRIMDHLVTTSRTSSARTRLYGRLAPLILERQQTSAERLPRDQVQSRVLQLGLDGLRTSETYVIAEAAFAQFETLWPTDPRGANCRMWRGWIECFRAYETVSNPVVYVSHYQQAAEHFDTVARSSDQQRLRNMAMESARQIKRKLRLIDRGAIVPSEIPIPREIVLWGESRERLSGTEWRFVDPSQRNASHTNGTGKPQVRFAGSRIFVAAEGGVLMVDYRLFVSADDELQLHGQGHFRDAAFLVNGEVVERRLTLRVIPLQTREPTEPTILHAELATGAIAPLHQIGKLPTL